jgi:predicted aconitase
MGARPTFTCAPYQTEAPPALGEQIAWSESNAVAFANSVCGARTNRYGDYLDISCALTGRVPAAGLHLDEGRRATVHVALQEIPPTAMERDDFYPLLGYRIGQVVENCVAVVEGLTPHPRPTSSRRSSRPPPRQARSPSSTSRASRPRRRPSPTRTRDGNPTSD